MKGKRGKKTRLGSVLQITERGKMVKRLSSTAAIVLVMVVTLALVPGVARAHMAKRRPGPHTCRTNIGSCPM